MDRRHFLQGSIALAATGFHARLFAAPPKQSGNGRLLVVFLRGAYDAASALVPIGSDFYYEARPTQSIARPDAANPRAAVRLNADWGLHPEIARALAPLLARGEVTFVPFVGVPGASRSHFQVQDLIEAGDDGASQTRHVDGLLYRLAAQTGFAQAISYTPSIPLIFRGDESVANINLKGGRGALMSSDEKAELAQLYAGHELGGMLQQAESLRSQADGTDEMAASAKGAAGAGSFRKQARKMARFLKRDHRLAFAEIGGWDSHINQGSRNGALATQLGGLAEGLSVFAESMGKAWQHTTVVVVSEFGRTFRENGNAGTDHGHGSAYWVLGGKISGAAVRGPHMALTPESLNEQRDYPVLLDYRALLGEAAALSLGLGRAQTEAIFGVAPSALLA
jgi:uncharacterized protein (DUF1501 family)